MAGPTTTSTDPTCDLGDGSILRTTTSPAANSLDEENDLYTRLEGGIFGMPMTPPPSSPQVATTTTSGPITPPVTANHHAPIVAATAATPGDADQFLWS